MMKLRKEDGEMKRRNERSREGGERFKRGHNIYLVDRQSPQSSPSTRCARTRDVSEQECRSRGSRCGRDKRRETMRDNDEG